ncbi:MAG: hypothetical protein ACJ8KX_05035 [Chthoniobacterales bacterium]
MSAILVSRNSAYQSATDSELTGLRKALDGAYGRVVQTARREWERSFGGFDPSDACVTVRITGGNSLRGQQYLAA